MDANRYFEEMHKAMTSQQAGSELLLTVKYQDGSGSDAYIELRRSAANDTARIYYSTMGRKYLNFQLLRTGWQLCHNKAGELIERPAKSAEDLIAQTDFHAFCRDEPFDSAKTARIVHELELCSNTWVERHAPNAESHDFCVTFDSYVGSGAHWAYSISPDEACLTPAAIIYWLAEHLAGSERRALQSNEQAAKLAAQWESEAVFSSTAPLSHKTAAAARTYQVYRHEQNTQQHRTAQNERWQSFLAVMAAV